jgi:malate/lactate dehydrogenase
MTVREPRSPFKAVDADLLTIATVFCRISENKRLSKANVDAAVNAWIGLVVKSAAASQAVFGCIGSPVDTPAYKAVLCTTFLAQIL